MPSIKTVAVAATLATSVTAYLTPLEARNDLDFTPDDLDVLFGRDVDIDFDDLDLLTRDLDLDAEDLDVLLTRSSSSMLSALGKGAKFMGAHKKGLSKTLSTGADLYGSRQSLKSQRLQNQQLQLQSQQQMGGEGQYQGLQQRRDLEDDIIELITRNPSKFSALGNMANSAAHHAKHANDFAHQHKDTIKSVGHHAKHAHDFAHKHKDTIKGMGHHAKKAFGKKAGGRPRQRVGAVMNKLPQQQQLPVNPQGADPQPQAPQGLQQPEQGNPEQEVGPGSASDPSSGAASAENVLAARDLFDGEEEPELWY